MVKIKVAINDFCRVGRSVFKIAQSRSDIEIAAIRTHLSAEQCAYLLKHDSIYGHYAKAIGTGDVSLYVGDRIIPIISDKRTTKLPWYDLGIDVLIDAGCQTDAAELRRHRTAGARRVASLSQCADFATIVIGVNDGLVNASTDIVCSGDAAISSVAPVIAVLDQAVGVEAATITAAGNYHFAGSLLKTERLGDSDLVAMAADYGQRLQAVLPNVASAVGGLAISSHQYGNVGLSTISLLLREPVAAKKINEILTHAAREPLYNGILAVTDKELVAEDFRGNSYSSTVDAGLTAVVGERLAQVSAWYDYEWASANRWVELAAETGRYARNVQ